MFKKFFFEQMKVFLFFLIAAGITFTIITVHNNDYFITFSILFGGLLCLFILLSLITATIMSRKYKSTIGTNANITPINNIQFQVPAGSIMKTNIVETPVAIIIGEGLLQLTPLLGEVKELPINSFTITPTTNTSLKYGRYYWWNKVIFDIITNSTGDKFCLGIPKKHSHEFLAQLGK